LRKTNYEEYKFLKTENIVFIFALNYSANKIFKIIHNNCNILLYTFIFIMMNIKTFK